MTGAVRQMLACHWSARRLQRYLDADPSAPLDPGETTRIEAHLAACQRCSEVLRQHRVLRRALSRWPGRHPLDPATLTRVRELVDDLAEDGTR